MTLLELINELQKLRTRVNDDIEVEVLVFEDGREDFLFDRIESIEETENEKDQRIVGITLEHSHQNYGPY